MARLRSALGTHDPKPTVVGYRPYRKKWMNYLLIAPDLGFESAGVRKGGLQAYGRSVARALASCPQISRLGVWCQVDTTTTLRPIQRMVGVYAHSRLDLDVRAFGGSRIRLSSAMAAECLHRSYDRIMYLLVNQATLSWLPAHAPYTVWEIGRELARPLPWWKCRNLTRATLRLSISKNTTETASLHNPHLPPAQVVHLCTEPPLYARETPNDSRPAKPYDPAARKPSVLIVGNMQRGALHKGHRQLIAAWPRVVKDCPDAELWITSEGDGRAELQSQAARLPWAAARKIVFLGYLEHQALEDRYRRCRVFALPSTGEGFGLVFVEAARFGVPCIAGKHDAAKEIVIDNRTGLLVEQNPNDVATACLRLLTDDPLALRLGEAGRRQYLKNFRFHHFRKRFLDALALG